MRHRGEIVMANSAILGIFAKRPRAGHVKTRLAQAASPEWAARVAAAFLEDTLDRLAHVPVTRAIVYAPSDSTDYFAALANGRFDLHPQVEGDLGQRLQAFFHEARQRKCARVVAIGADSPTLPVEFVEQAFVMLEKKEVVIGPAFDGGYYLIGCGSAELPLFADIPWSTANVLATTIERAGTHTLELLPPWYDVDTPEDWHLLRGHVLAMRAAGIDVGSPRVERLVMEKE